MTIETKYGAGDTVWVLDDNKLMTRMIIVVDIWANKEGVNIKYKMASSDIHKNCKEYYPETSCYPTKEALLQSL